jgi:hypothetical protein
VTTHYTIIRQSGRSENVRDGHTYWDVLSTIYNEFQGAGGNWDRPKMLLLNAEVVVADGLANAAWEYGKHLYDARAKAVTDTQEAHKPEWLREIERKAGK